MLLPSSKTEPSNNSLERISEHAVPMELTSIISTSLVVLP